jgi:glucose/arabinose dehydrogenase
MCRAVRRLGGLVVALCLVHVVPAAASEVLSPGFSDTTVFANLPEITAVRFAPHGDPRVFVAMQSGRIDAFSSLSAATPVPVADLSAEVDDYWDRGLLGLAVDPQFPVRPYLYLLYTYDAAIGQQAPRWGDVCPTPPGPNLDGCVVSGRLSRIQIDPATDAMVPGSETVLINDWCQQYPSGSVDDLVFDRHGELLVSAGQGGNFYWVDYGQGGGRPGSPTPANPCGDPPVPVGGAQAPPTAEGGDLRSQSFSRSDGPASLDGSVIRVDPASGAPANDNPALASADANRRRIIAYGLRQPFRLALRPDTGEVWIADVGWDLWESIDRLADPGGPVVNFGWPCYEGPDRQPKFEAAGLNVCKALYAGGGFTAPFYAYGDTTPVLEGDRCDSTRGSITGLAFAHGGPYPTSYTDSLFFADHTRNCIWAMLTGADGLPDPTRIVSVASGAGHPVDLQRGPDGFLYYADHDDGQVQRLGYGSPQAAVAANATSGTAPLRVSLIGDQTSDPDPGAGLRYHWSFGDGSGFDGADAIHSYATPGTYQPTLTVTDQSGQSSSRSLTIVVLPGAGPSWSGLVSTLGTVPPLTGCTLRPFSMSVATSASATLRCVLSLPAMVEVSLQRQVHTGRRLGFRRVSRRGRVRAVLYRRGRAGGNSLDVGAWLRELRVAAGRYRLVVRLLAVDPRPPPLYSYFTLRPKGGR